MKKGWMIVLLVSLGLNLGLGYRLWRVVHAMPEPASARQGAWGQGRGGVHHGRGGFRSADRDSLWRQGMMERRLRRLAMALDLRPEQVEAMRAIQMDQGETVRREGRRLMEMRRDVARLLEAPEPDRDQVRGLMHAMGARRAVLDSLVTETIMRELEVLDPPQRETYLRILPLERGPFPGGGGGPGGGPSVMRDGPGCPPPGQ